MAKRDYYSILGVPRDASDKEIKQAYRRLARRYHPDVNPGDTAAEHKFKEISEAYAVLGNVENRKKYDHFGHQAFSAGFDPSFSRGNASGGFQTGNVKDFFGGRGNFSEGFSSIFEEFFGRGQSRSHSTTPRGQDIEQTVDLRFEDAIRGTTTEVRVTRGDGRVEWLRVKIPPGVDTNSKIRLAGKGEAGMYGNAPGDLYIVTRVKPHAHFVRQGSDIMCELPITLAEAVLGAKIEIPTIDGQTTMTLPAGTQNGRKFRLRGKGAPHLKGRGRGDQYVTVKLVLPEAFDSHSRKLIEEFEQRNPLQPRAQMRW
jgi:DnaJ-class molecular chaperone